MGGSRLGPPRGGVAYGDGGDARTMPPWVVGGYGSTGVVQEGDLPAAQVEVSADVVAGVGVHPIVADGDDDAGAAEANLRQPRLVPGHRRGFRGGRAVQVPGDDLGLTLARRTWCRRREVQ